MRTRRRAEIENRKEVGLVGTLFGLRTRRAPRSQPASDSREEPTPEVSANGKGDSNEAEPPDADTGQIDDKKCALDEPSGTHESGTAENAAAIDDPVTAQNAEVSEPRKDATTVAADKTTVDQDAKTTTLEPVRDPGTSIVTSDTVLAESPLQVEEQAGDKTSKSGRYIGRKRTRANRM